MTTRDAGPAFDAFTAAAAEVAKRRPEVDADIARELLQEAAIRLHDGLAFDGLDDHDLAAVVTLLATDLTAMDPVAAVHARARTVREPDSGLHDAEAVAATYLDTVRILQL